ncbi:MAG: hypothetical protein HUJ75_07995, partial [Parasporobacterium sp.]|nr:hypothetical protein [Parasporobacterium sp.]
TGEIDAEAVSPAFANAAEPALSAEAQAFVDAVDGIDADAVNTACTSQDNTVIDALYESLLPLDDAFLDLSEDEQDLVLASYMKLGGYLTALSDARVSDSGTVYNTTISTDDLSQMITGFQIIDNGTQVGTSSNKVQDNKMYTFRFSFSETDDDGQGNQVNMAYDSNTSSPTYGYLHYELPDTVIVEPSTTAIPLYYKGNHVGEFKIVDVNGKHVIEAKFDDVDGDGNPSPNNFIKNVGLVKFDCDFTGYFDTKGNDKVNMNLGNGLTPSIEADPSNALTMAKEIMMRDQYNLTKLDNPRIFASRAVLTCITGGATVNSFKDTCVELNATTRIDYQYVSGSLKV